MNGHDLVPARPSDTCSPRPSDTCSPRPDGVDAIARCMIEHAARRAPTALSERLLEEWLADAADHLGRAARLRFALGCYWAATLIKHECSTVSTPVAGAPGLRIMMAGARYGMAPFPRRTAATGSGPAPVICEINTTPLIDVLLVLLVTLIITLPLMTQGVRLNLPQSSSGNAAPPEVINLDIDFDGTVVWNGSPVAGFAQLEGYFRTESHKYPQPEIDLRPDAYVKYDVVAKVLAAAQRNHLTKVGFVNNGEFAD